MTKLLLEMGADPRHLGHEEQRWLLGLGEIENGVKISREEFLAGRFRRFGKSNAERMEIPCWRAMIESGASGFRAY